MMKRSRGVSCMLYRIRTQGTQKESGKATGKWDDWIFRWQKQSKHSAAKQHYLYNTLSVSNDIVLCNLYPPVCSKWARKRTLWYAFLGAGLRSVCSRTIQQIITHFLRHTTPHNTVKWSDSRRSQKKLVNVGFNTSKLWQSQTLQKKAWLSSSY